MQYSNNIKSSFWLKDDYLNIDVLNNKVQKDPIADIIRLASYRRAISNFVNLVTGKSIPVKFTKKGDSYTDGKSVVISSNLKEKDFDSAVGLALHEGSHILLSDFSLLRDLGIFFASKNSYLCDTTINLLMKKYDQTARGDLLVQILPQIKMILNIIEDRRIDNFIYKNSPGYRGYYHSLYEKYFHSRAIDKALKSTSHRKEDWESYLMRLVNITNTNRDLDSLNGLRKIFQLIDLKNISRLKTTKDALELSCKIFKIIEDNIPDPETTNKEKEESKGSCGEESENSSSEKNKENDSCESTSDGEDEGSDAGKSLGEFDLTDKQEEQLEKALDNQKGFLEGKIKKGQLTTSKAQRMEAFENAEADLKMTGKDVNPYERDNFKGFETLIINNFGWPLVGVGLSGLVRKKSKYTDENSPGCKKAKENIEKGLILGNMLGRKLQIRNEEKDTKYSRLSAGKIDRRLIAGLGYGAENVFNQITKEKYNAANVHLSVDASGSMNGDKWDKALVTTVAIAKAASMVGNINVQISFRSTTCSGGSRGGLSTPTILIAYDSRKDKISKIRDLFPYVYPGGLTPEGLCFEAISSKMLEKQNGLDSYFINFSDGQPYCNGGSNGAYYGGTAAARHTQNQVKKMRKKGLKVLSYFISSKDEMFGGDGSKFKTMYGEGSSYINVQNLGQLAKSLNEMFI
tara:strand:- start:4011 stop:6071 length:2061 start_codon:yes stop_codon:yes gene_type:complete